MGSSVIRLGVGGDIKMSPFLLLYLTLGFAESKIFEIKAEGRDTILDNHDIADMNNVVRKQSLKGWQLVPEVIAQETGRDNMEVKNKNEIENILFTLAARRKKSRNYWNMIQRQIDQGLPFGKNVQNVQGGAPDVELDNSSVPPLLDSSLLTSAKGYNVYCPCKVTVLSSLGDAARYQPHALGTYKYYQAYNNLPAYAGPGGNRIYWTPSGGWLVGAKIGAGVGYIHNPGDGGRTCPYMLTQGWMFYNPSHNLWYPDPTLVFRCVP